MGKSSLKELSRQKRKVRVRKKIKGTEARPRLSVFKSAKHIYAQLIDDSKGCTLASYSTLSKSIDNSGNIEAAAEVGKEIARTALEKKIESIVFDRNGFIYHGRVKALAEAAREVGLLF